MIEGNEVLGVAHQLARAKAVMVWAEDTSRPILTEDDVEAAAAEFSELPYEDRRKYNVRPTKLMLKIATDVCAAQDAHNMLMREALAHYFKAGDAVHAMRMLGKEVLPEDEQKRISAGRAEILEADLTPITEEGNVLEDYAEAATEGLYDAAGWAAAADVVLRDAMASEVSDRLLPVVRAAMSGPEFLAFMYTQVDERPLREVAEYMRLSPVTVNRYVQSAMEKVRHSVPEWDAKL